MMRYGQMVTWLQAEGISESEVLKLIGGAVIVPQILRPNSRAFYYRSQIRRDVLKRED